MPETDARQRFDRLLNAMVPKPPVDVGDKDEPHDDDGKREDDAD